MTKGVEARFSFGSTGHQAEHGCGVKGAFGFPRLGVVQGGRRRARGS